MYLTAKNLCDKILEKGCDILSKITIGSKIIKIEETSSTNDLAKVFAKNGVKEGTVIIASRQTGGKGRMGRSFFSPDGKGIYMSFILKPQDNTQNTLLITSFAVVAVCRAIKKICGVNAEIKWINDVYLNGKKVCGILAEALTYGNKIEHIIVGIGINVKKTEFPEELKKIATSIENETDREVSIDELINQLLIELDELYKSFSDRKFLDEIRDFSNVIGKQITVSKGNENYNAEAIGIDDEGGLEIIYNNKREVLYSGEISVRVI